MEFPVCTFDLKTGVLCSSCEEKVRRGEISSLDVEIMRFILELERRMPYLASLNYVKSVKVDDYLFLVLRERSLSALEQDKQAEVRRVLSERFRLKVELVEDSRDLNKFIQNLVHPARVLAVNKMWLPDQSTEIRVIIDEERKLRAPLNILAQVVKMFKGLSMSFESQRKRPSGSRSAR
ncbi:MAG: hypothetical protein NZ570_01985 [Candidatus Caldarchaeum sp.]|nr:hypothetical protein [Candidatus Caldarchaeum sp.]MDW7978907.1 hypothetical protein [Candidatus Caldarchaeum sp.]MDW8359847.1 hypothetical protein [Candidatus Caldarchaeum sp.]